MDAFPNLTFEAGSEMPGGELYEAIRGNRELAIYVLRLEDDDTFVFLDANGPVSQIAGVPLEAIIGKSPEQCLPDPIGACLTENLRLCAQSDAPVSYVRTLPQGSRSVSFSTTLTPVPSREGAQARYILGVTRDVTRETDYAETAERHAAILSLLGITLPSVIYIANILKQTIRFLGSDAAEPPIAWRSLAEQAGAMAAAQYLHPDDTNRAFTHLHRLQDLKDGEVATSSVRIRASDGTYRRHSNRETVFRRDASGAVELVLGVSEDVSEQDRAHQTIHDLSSRMLTLQIEERRRIAQELHDSTGQHLTVAMLALGNARTIQQAETEGEPSQRLEAALDDARGAVQEALREIRVLSYLLHPPKLSSKQLNIALESFAIGFGKRAGLKVELSIPPDAADLDDEIALQLFRVCQEALTNVYRHAQAKSVFVLLTIDDRSIRLTVKDDGRGFADNGSRIVEGVGLQGMRARMNRLGGGLRIVSNETGTSLIATVRRSHGDRADHFPLPGSRAPAT